MRINSLSSKIYWALIILLAILSALTIFLPQGNFLPMPQDLPASKPLLALVNAGIVLIVYGVLGFIGLQLARRLDFADIWDKQVSNAQRFIIPTFIGMSTGAFFIVVDAILQDFHSLRSIPHPPFPTSIVASLSAGIGEEVIFRLFFIPFWFWLVARVILKGKQQEAIFWSVTTVSALLFAIGHLPSTILILGLESAQDVPVAIWLEIFVLNGVLSFLTAYFLRKNGFLAAVGIHFWTDVVWHVLWGPIG